LTGSHSTPLLHAEACVQAGGLVIPGLLPAGRRGEPFSVMARYAVCRQLRSIYDKCIITNATAADGGPFQVHVRRVADAFCRKHVVKRVLKTF